MPPTPAPTFAGMRLVDADEVAASTSVADAATALESALRAGTDPDADVPRTRVDTATGHLLVMPSAAGGASGVKVLSATPGNAGRGLPSLQGHLLLFDGPGQRPVALVDGAALTLLRTPAVSLLAVRHLAPPAAGGRRRVVVLGTGPQARAHLDTLLAEGPVGEVVLVGRHVGRLATLARHAAHRGAAVTTRLLDGAGGTSAAVDDAVDGADLVVCCTGAREPLFDGARLADDAVVVAMGSHSPDAREVDERLVGRAQVVVESRGSALREAGDVVLAVAAGALDGGDLVPLRDVVTGRAQVRTDRPRLFKGTGMAWEDLVVARHVAGVLGALG